ncbi:MAG: hypothetical protein LC800_21370 [Acidobacteria bacterium]|nr:hypothetical protein [Acidobacteriota bacterium]
MEERVEQLTTGAGGEVAPAADPDKTLVSPRFDVREERTAQPVVPLAEPAARGGRLRSSSLPVMLILVSAVVGGLVSVLAYRAYQRRPAQPAAQEQQQQQTPAAEAAVSSPTPELVVEAQMEEAQPEEPHPSEGADANAGAETAARAESAVVKEDRKPEAATAPERAPRRTNDAARPERESEPPRSRRVDVISGPVGERVSRRERARDDSEIEGEATDYEAPAERRARRRAARRAARRNVDRVRAIFEGDPPRLD